MRWSKTGAGLAVLAVVALCCALGVSGAGPAQQLTVYTAQTSYSLPVLDRDGKPYISVRDLLSPLGASQPTTKGKEWKIGLTRADVRLTVGNDKGTVNKQMIDLGGKVFIENGRLLVPMDALLPLLGRLLNTTIDFHRPARRVFVGNTSTRFTADFKNGDDPSLVLNFSQPVKPDENQKEKRGILTHTDKTTLIFRKDALVSDLKTQQYGDGAIQSLFFFEENGAAVLTVTGNKHLQLIRSDDGKTFTLKPEPPEVATTPMPAQSAAPSADGQKRAPEFFVMIDPSHGGNDRGATFGGKLLEKDITLRLARELRKELEEHGISTRLLRESDIDLSLDRRAEITNEQRASVYVALHAGRPGKGVRVYAPILTEAQQQPLAGRFLPWESAQSGALGRSQNVARAVSEELKKKGLTVANLGVSLRPLNNICTPAIAVELAPEEADPQSLESQKRQTNVATAIALGIVQIRSQIGARQ
jgi:N-acetylmuramoyl-L-alanine amidase